MKVEVVPVVFNPGQPWQDYTVVLQDFISLYRQAQGEGIACGAETAYLLDLAATVFVFNDNLESWAKRDHERGGGNAVIRSVSRNPIAHLNRPLACGIPTGSQGRGFSSLSDNAKSVIDTALEELHVSHILKGARRIVYCAESDEDATIGTGIFNVSQDVKDYITSRLWSFNGMKAPRKSPISLVVKPGNRACFNT
jgi:hypothetical protein